MISPWIIGAIIGLSVLFGVGSRFVFKKTDNVVEQAAERVIKDYTNIDIDLSPDTPDGRERSFVMDEPLDINKALADLPSELPDKKILKD